MGPKNKDFQIQKPNDENGELKTYKSGTVIFREQEIGGSLYFIKSGEVEIYQTRQGTEIILAVLGPGEVLGTMSLLTKDKRLASARAKTNVTTLYIDSVNVDELIQSVPFWVKTVIKDFVLRIQFINSQFCQLKLTTQMQDPQKPNKLKLAQQIANGLSILSNYVSLQNRQLNLNECLSQLTAIIQCPLSEVKSIIKVFEKSGLISAKTSAPPILNQEAVEALQIFSQFVQANAAQVYSSEILEKLLFVSQKIATQQRGRDPNIWVELNRKQLNLSDENMSELASFPHLQLSHNPDTDVIRLNTKALGALLSSFVTIDMLSDKNTAENKSPTLVA